MADWPPAEWDRKLLTEANPLQVLPDLAVAIGFNESLVMQQVHYWTRKGKDEEGWVYNTLAEWRKQFAFWSEDTIKRAFRSLRDQDLVEVAQRRGSDRTNSYRINYAALERVAGGQFAPINRAAATLQEGISPSSSSNNPETTQKGTNRIPDSQLRKEWGEWLAHFIEVTKRTATRGGSKEARRLFAGRRHDGRTLEELKEATVGCHGDDYCRREGFDRPETILRDGNVARYIELARQRAADGKTKAAKRSAYDKIEAAE